MSVLFDVVFVISAAGNADIVYVVQSTQQNKQIVSSTTQQHVARFEDIFFYVQYLYVVIVNNVTDGEDGVGGL